MLAAMGIPVWRPSPADAANPLPWHLIPTGLDTTLWALRDLRAAVRGCRACELCTERKRPVFGSGSLHADWMVVGDTPTLAEDTAQEPFVGDAGTLLDNMLRAVGLDRHADLDAFGSSSGSLRGVFLTHAVKCRPPGDRQPTNAEIAQCGDFLHRQMTLIRPKVLLLLGKLAVRSVLKVDPPFGSLREQVHPLPHAVAVVTYPPGHLIRNPREKAKAWADLCLAMSAAPLARKP